MKEEYNYTKLIDILRGMFDPDKVKNQDCINWAKLQLESTDSIIAKLYEFENDSQRTGFLNDVFRRFFDDGKGYNLALYVVQGKDGFENELDFKFIQNCKWVLNGLIYDVSEACLQYEGVDFSIIMSNLPMHFPKIANEYNFTWIKIGTPDDQSHPKNSFANFDEVFRDLSEIDKCINALKKVDPPIIDDSGRFLGKNKGAFVIWIEVLRRKGKLHTISDNLLPELLKKKFPGLIISPSLFRQPLPRVEVMYRLDFQALI